MSCKATICSQPGSNLADKGTPAEIKKLISGSFPGISWRNESAADLTGDIGYCSAGNGGVMFSIFTRGGEMIEGIAVEISGRLNDIALGAVYEFCDRNGLKLYTESSFEDVVETEGQPLSAGVLRAFKVMERHVLSMVV